MSILNASSHWELFIDGASRNNPGPAGAGLYLLKEGSSIVEKGVYLGLKTNNQAEYLALLLGLYFAQQHIPSNDILHIKTDSELMVRQITGVYRVKNKELARLHTQVKALLSKLQYTIHHVRREQNKVADKLANTGIDKKIGLPQEFLKVWPYEEIV